MLIRNSMDMLAPPRTPGMFAGLGGLGAGPADVWNQNASTVQQFFNSEFSWWPESNPVKGITDQFGVTVYYIDYDLMIAWLDNQIQVQTELNAGNERSYQYALNNPIVGGDPDVWPPAITSGRARLAELQTKLAKVNDYASQQQTGYQAWLLSQYEAREAARLAEIDARVAAMQQSQARSRAETEARNVVLAAEDAARNAAIIQQIMDDAAARGAAALAQQTSARDANVVEVLNRRAAGEDLVSVAVDFIRSLGLGPATDVFLAALTGADPGAVMRDIIEPANVIVTGVRSEPIVVVQAVQEVAQTAAVAATQAAEVAVASGDEAAAAVATAAAAAATNAANAATSATTVQTAASAAATAQQAAQTATTAAQTATAAATTTVTTTGDLAMPQLPANLGTMTEAQKIAWYRATLAAGFTNEAIRAAVEAVYGRQSDSDWTYLRTKAAAQPAAPAGGGAGLLVAAAAAAFFLLG
jgi:hypothetical protein